MRKVVRENAPAQPRVRLEHVHLPIFFPQAVGGSQSSQASADNDTFSRAASSRGTFPECSHGSPLADRADWGE
jgi:hypothetical protein